MTTILLAKFGPWIVAAISMLAAFLGVRHASKTKNEADAKIAATNAVASEHDAIVTRQVVEERAAAETSDNTVRKANDETAKVNAGADGDAISELRHDWTRPGEAT